MSYKLISAHETALTELLKLNTRFALQKAKLDELRESRRKLEEEAERGRYVDDPDYTGCGHDDCCPRNEVYVAGTPLPPDLDYIRKERDLTNMAQDTQVALAEQAGVVKATVKILAELLEDAQSSY